MWWNLGVLVTAHAAELRSSWRRSSWFAGRLRNKELQESSLEWTRAVAILHAVVWLRIGWTCLRSLIWEKQDLVLEEMWPWRWIKIKQNI
jgi:hypothetical protein